MPPAARIPDTTHLRASLIALGMLVLAAAAAVPYVSDFNRRHADMMLIRAFPEKNQGEWLQREAFTRDGLLPVYGTSELTLVVPNRASDFFADAPTGFQICPVGGPGNTSILMAEKLAALGGCIRGKKIVVILSSSWFTRPGVQEDSYAGNFSPLHATLLLENEALGPELRRRFAARMMQFPDTLSSNPAMRKYLGSFLEDGRPPWFIRAVLRPVLDGECARLRAEDSLAMADYVRVQSGAEDPPRKKALRAIPWDSLISAAEKSDPRADASLPPRDYASTDGDKDADFVAKVDESREWDDFTLLADTLQLYQAKVLVLTTPLDGLHHDKEGVSRVARNHYYGKMRALCAERNFACECFPDHDMDPGFLIPGSSHFTEKGWLYVNRVLDNFYHGRLSPPGKTAVSRTDS